MPAHGQGRAARILLVEDNVDSRTVIADSLTLAGHEVYAAGSGEEALDALPEARPDIMLVHRPAGHQRLRVPGPGTAIAGNGTGAGACRQRLRRGRGRASGGAMPALRTTSSIRWTSAHCSERSASAWESRTKHRGNDCPSSRSTPAPPRLGRPAPAAGRPGPPA